MNPTSTNTQSFRSFRMFMLALCGGMLGGVFGTYLYLFYGVDPLSFAYEREEEVPAVMEPESYTLRYSEQETTSVVERANPAVVSILVQKEVVPRSRQFSGSPFNDFFLNIPGFPFEEYSVPQNEEPESTEERPKQQVGGGSGFIVEADGLIVTNRHVVDDEDAEYIVVLSDGTEYTATVLAKDPIFDLALLDINAEDLPTLPLGDSDQLQLGQSVIAIGYALAEFGNTVTTGVVSGIDRRIEAGNGYGFSEVITEAIQTDAAINPGNSGGPLLNLAGEVIGINTAVSNRGQALGFAISINSVRRSIESVRDTGEIIRPWLGVRYILVNERMAEMNNLTVDYGALVLRGRVDEELAVIPGSPADKAGIVENDIILAVNGEEITVNSPLAEMIVQYNVGDILNLRILHDGEEKEVEVTLEAFGEQR